MLACETFNCSVCDLYRLFQIKGNRTLYSLCFIYLEHNERNAVTDLTDLPSHCCNPDSLAKPCPKTWVCNVCIQFLRAIIYFFFFCIEFNIKIEWKTTIQLSVCTSFANNIIVLFLHFILHCEHVQVYFTSP